MPTTHRQAKGEKSGLIPEVPHINWALDHSCSKAHILVIKSTIHKFASSTNPIGNGEAAQPPSKTCVTLRTIQMLNTYQPGTEQASNLHRLEIMTFIINLRPKVTFDLSPPELEPVQTSTQRTSGHQRKRSSTVRMRKTTTSGASYTQTPFKELLNNLTESQCRQLASALFPRSESRVSMPRRRRRRVMLPRRKRRREHETDSEEESYGASGSYSSGGGRRKTGSEDTSDSEESSGLDDTDADQGYPPVRTRLAPIQFSKDCKPLGPWV
ncbi:hypothetical protein [Mosquito VEM Anellovirus SDBVL B]|nr:hypothetical protein [Mosquito VEM Anellovirus SDBVL B]